MILVDHWRLIRKATNSMFSLQTVNELFPHFNRAKNQAVLYFNEVANRGDQEILMVIRKISLYAAVGECI